ncbi:MAG: M13 family metallopeptidase [Flavipsychrobacter sp.]|nr:M13 family metallopeptidase [Flavipsychrobacter sp.]
MNFKKIALASAAFLTLASFDKADNGHKLLDPANIDNSVRPGDNFYMYANGTWLKNNPIPSTETEWGSFNEVQEFNYKALHTLLDSAMRLHNAAKGSTIQKVGDFYRSGMDTVAIEKAGIKPLAGSLARIEKIKTTDELLKEIALEQTEGINPLYGFSVGPDDKDVTKEICQFSQAGLGLPDRDYYFNTDPNTTRIRNAYQKYVPSMLVLAGETEAEATKNGADIYKLETSLANASMTRLDMRDPYKTYNKFSIAGINKKTPGMDWRALLTDLRVTGQDSVLVGMPDFFTRMAAQIKETPVSVWKEYLKFHLVNNTSAFLSSKFNALHFDFYGRTLSGQQEQKPRWKRVLAMVDGSIGELLGQMYVDKYFKPEAKTRMLNLVNNLQKTYADRIQRSDWMSADTKAKALIKLNAFVKKIGYPDKWKDYSKLDIVGDNYVKNIMATSVFEYNYNLHKLGRPVDRAEWGMTPPTVNAYYNPGFNEIVFPAGILQYPFFDFSADDAVNYGGIGAVIGHEMTHGFDDQGRLYNDVGNLTNWWNSTDSAHFVARAGRVVDQFNKSVVLDTMHVNGELTEGENLADLGGLNIAYEAFKKTKEGQSNDKIDGFTPDQRFFLSWAQVWRANNRPESIAQRLMLDPHSPEELRCNVPISNMDAWYKAFNIQPGDKLYRPADARASVW